MEDVNPVSRASRISGLALASAFVPLVLYCALIFHLSSKTGGELPHFWLLKHDKICHTLEYGGLGFLLCRVLLNYGVSVSRALLLASLLGLLYGISDEFHQSFVPNRQGNDLGDMTADLTGSILGAASYMIWATRLRSRFGKGGTT